MPNGTKRPMEPTPDGLRRTRTRSVKARLNADKSEEGATPTVASKAQVRGKQRRSTPKTRTVRPAARRGTQNRLPDKNEDEIQPQDVVGDANLSDGRDSEHSTVSLQVTHQRTSTRRVQDHGESGRSTGKDIDRRSEPSHNHLDSAPSTPRTKGTNTISDGNGRLPVEGEPSPALESGVERREEDMVEKEALSGAENCTSMSPHGTPKSHGNTDTNINQLGQVQSELSPAQEAPPMVMKNNVDYTQRVAEIEDVRAMQKFMNTKLDKVVEKLEQYLDVQNNKDECDELRNIVHSLLGNIEASDPPQSIIENKLVPLRRAIIGPGGVHKRSMGKHIIDSLVNACDVETLDMKTLNDFAAVLRTVLYSTNSGGRKEYTGDNDEMADHHTYLKKKITFICVAAIQGREDIGQLTMFCNGIDRVIMKPAWMRKGFTKGKHITEFYSTGRAPKKPKQCKEDDGDVLQYHIIKKINDTHNSAFNKIRDRVRVDGMKEFWFLFEEHEFEYTDGPPDDQRLFPLSKLPVIDLNRLPDKELPGVVKKVWDGLRDIADGKMTYIVEHNVIVGGKSERKLRRTIDLLSVSTMILMRMSCSSSIVDLLAYNAKTTYAIITLAEVLRHLLQLHRRRPVAEYLEEVTHLSPDYHILKVLQDIRPTKVGTRKEMLRKIVEEMDENEFDRLHHDEYESEDDDTGTKNRELVDLDDNGEFGDELNDAIDFLL